MTPNEATYDYEETTDSPSAVSWGAIFAGAATAAAASLVLLMLGVGLGLSAISPWAQRGVDAATFGVSSIVWVTVTQLCASALGGYLAGRLRTRWAAVHTDEVFFRDTAHGLLAWAVATLVTASILLSATAGAIGATAQASASVASGVASAGKGVAVQALQANTDDSGPMAYLVDSLFRRDVSSPATGSATPGTPGADTSTMADNTRPPLAEASRIFANASGLDKLLPQDVRYLGQLVAQRTGLPQPDAERRVTDTYAALQTSVANAKAAAADAADKARKAGIKASLWLFIALLCGAFIASYTATLGGRERDTPAVAAA